MVRGAPLPAICDKACSNLYVLKQSRIDNFIIACPKLPVTSDGGELHLQAARGLQLDQIILELVVGNWNRERILYPRIDRQIRKVSIKSVRQRLQMTLDVDDKRRAQIILSVVIREDLSELREVDE
ncbi:Uncharacterised protein r2_g4080 [Pycnogonum litorale]